MSTILFVLATGVAFRAAADDAATLTFDTVVAGLSPATNTSLGIRTFWETYRNQPIAWKAVVVDVKGGRRGATIYLADKQHPLHRGHNIVLVTGNKAGAGALRPGDVLQFKGTLHRYSAKPGRPVVVIVANGELVQFETTVPQNTLLDEATRRFAVFADAVSRDKNTEVGAKANWAALKMRTVTFTATVVDVKGGHGRAKVFLAAEGAPLHDGYNIVLITEDSTTAASLPKGGPIAFSGTPYRYSQRKGGPVVLTVSRGLFLK